MSHTFHSSDYKKLAIEHYLENGSLRKTCEIIKCSKSSLYDWIVKDLNKTKRKQKTKKYPDEMRKFIIEYVKNNVISTLSQVQNVVKKKFKSTPSISMIHYILEDHNITRKRLVKKYFPAKKKDIEKDLLKQFYKNVNKFDIKKIISLDETAVYINMLPTYGRSEKGKQAIRKTHIYPYKKFNLIVAMKYNKIIGWELSKEPYNTSKLEKFINTNLNKYKNHLLIFDNAVFHKSKTIIQCLDKLKIKHLYIVPYHPENNPIEHLFSQLKSYLNVANCQSFEEILAKTKYILKNNITKENLTNYIKTIYDKYNK